MRGSREILTITTRTVPLAWLLIMATFAIRAIHPAQPIVENYVGRQIPTAMVARNLDRGSGFLHPELDTGPFPNLFLVEPPVFAWLVVQINRLTGWGMEPCGRLLSAFGASLAAWGLWGLASTRAGPSIALMATAVFSALPVTVRYGRAFQGDALMLGAVLAACRFFDEYRQSHRWSLFIAGWVLLSLGLGLKVTASWVLAPIVLSLLGGESAWKRILAAAALVPALLWYGHALSHLVGSQSMSAASETSWVWLHSLNPLGLLSWRTLNAIGRNLFVKAFTPVGIIAAAAGWIITRRLGAGATGGAPDHFWGCWVIFSLFALLALGSKSHHEYYWIVLSPAVALGVSQCLWRLWCLGGVGRFGSVVVGTVLAALCFYQTLSTWRTPEEWRLLPAAALQVREVVPRSAWLVAPEALLYAADRRGCRLEFDRGAAERAAREWGGTLPSPPIAPGLALIEFYRERGALYAADLARQPDDERAHMRTLLKRHFRAVLDSPEAIVVKLDEALSH